MISKNCKQCQQEFSVTDDDLDFFRGMSVSTAEKNVSISEPSLCPTCRIQRRLAYRNERHLYPTKCDLTGQSLISMYDPRGNYKVYNYKDWWSDKWNPIDYGRDYDPSKTFFEQLKDLQTAVPRFNLFNADTENCEYVNYSPHCKNCYLVFGSWFSENCMYGQSFLEDKDSLDCLLITKSELCYQCIDCDKNYKTFFCQNTNDSRESYFCFDCTGVKNCLYCYNLRNKQYYINNKPSTKEKFDEEVKKLKSAEYLEFKQKQFDEAVKNQAIFKSCMGFSNENVSGNFIFNSKNCRRCFSSYYSCRAVEQKNSQDIEGTGKGERVFEAMSNDFSYHAVGCSTCEHLRDSHYCDLCFNGDNLFGCVGLRQKRYCILNKQYTPEEYEKKISEIISDMVQAGEWGEFPPVKNSPFAYNESVAQEYFSLNRSQAEERGFNWREEIQKESSKQNYELPDDIDDAEVGVLNEVLECPATGKNFKIIPYELDFLKKNHLPLPRLHPDERHRLRLKKQAPRFLYNRSCSSCSRDIDTSYNEELAKNVYCEDCYQKSII